MKKMVCLLSVLLLSVAGCSRPVRSAIDLPELSEMSTEARPAPDNTMVIHGSLVEVWGTEPFNAREARITSSLWKSAATHRRDHTAFIFRLHKDGHAECEVWNTQGKAIRLVTFWADGSINDQRGKTTEKYRVSESLMQRTLAAIKRQIER